VKILFIAPYPFGEAPSQRFRFEQYFPELRRRDIEIHHSPFLDLDAWRIIYRKRHYLQKGMALLRGYYRRFRDLLRMSRYDFVFIHREASPYGPPFFEWMIAKVFRKKIIFDFDDAIWNRNTSEHNQFFSLLKRYKNANDICRWAYKVSVGNYYLAEHASLYNKSVVYNPTTIDTDEHHNTTTKHSNNKFIIGWTGSHSTIQYLDALVPVFEELEKKYDFELHIICDVKPRFQLKSLVYVKWSKQAEIDDLLNFNVGIMPLTDDEWTRGKCGFKALQYMALGVPAVVSDVGVNSEIVDHEINGCICRSPEDWKKYLCKLLSDKDYLLKLSSRTREKIVLHYSLNSNKDNFIGLFS
jgi:glycosyltransferase involved in cell wall biosynthesis